MLFQSVTFTLLTLAGMVKAGRARRYMDIRKRATVTTADDIDTSLILVQDAIASGSFSDGLTKIGGNEAFEAASATSQNNFINFCEGETLTNGLQIVTGSCNGIPMGQIPAKTKMMSSIITFPLAGSATIESDTTFKITVQMSNIIPGSFSNAVSTYFSAPQQLDESGVVIGHTHVTVQDMGSSLNPIEALDPTQFAFFKGINDPENDQGLLSATVTGGLPAGNYRVCTLASSTNHQPVIMPVAQRGTADDCTKFTVIGPGITANAASDNGSGGQAAAALAASAVAAGPDNTNPVAVSTSSAESSAIISATKSSQSRGKNTKASSALEAAATDDALSDSGCASQATQFTTVFSDAAVATSTNSRVASSTTSAPFSPSAFSSPATSSTSALGGITAPPITDSGDPTRPFLVNGNAFLNEAAALQRSCDIQFNACANAFNSGTADNFDISDCQEQKNNCSAG